MQTPHTMSTMLLVGLLTMTACQELPTDCDPETYLQGEEVNCTPDSPLPPDDHTTPSEDDEGERDETHDDEDPKTPTEDLGESGYPILNYVLELENFNSTQDQRVKEAMRKAHTVLNSKAFQDRVLNHEFQGSKTFVDNRGMTNLQIYQTIMEGREDLLPKVDHTMNISLSMYTNNWTSTVGYTYPDTLTIWVNSKFFNSNSYGRIAANVVHEWTHKLGFEHSYYNDYARPYSVPYAIGSIVEELVDQTK